MKKHIGVFILLSVGFLPMVRAQEVICKSEAQEIVGKNESGLEVRLQFKTAGKSTSCFLTMSARRNPNEEWYAMPRAKISQEDLQEVISRLRPLSPQPLLVPAAKAVK